jgi:hypothetical protein
VVNGDGEAKGSGSAGAAEKAPGLAVEPGSVPRSPVVGARWPEKEGGDDAC